MFSEFMPDPTDVADSEGEYLEVRLGEASDSLYLRFEEKAEFSVGVPEGTRLLLHRDTTACPSVTGLVCMELTSSSLPNSRTTTWSLRQGDCIDSAYLPIPSSGKALLRADSAYDAWEVGDASPGYPNSIFEEGLDDCALELAGYTFAGGSFAVELSVSKCDSAEVSYAAERLDLAGTKTSGTAVISGVGTISIPSKSGLPVMFKANVPEDDLPTNDSLDTLLVSPENSPIHFTEVHHCPSEGNAEWLELYNALPRALPLLGFDLCSRGTFYVTEADSILAYESILLTRDTTALRSELGFDDVKIFRASMGTLKNTSDTVALCYAGDTLETVIWTKTEYANCPAGFNPQTGNSENTPGFQGRTQNSLGASPFTIEVSSRVSRKGGDPPRARILGSTTVTLVLLSEGGRRIWEKSVSGGNAWVELPLLGQNPGVYFLKCIAGRYEKTVGLILRP